MGKKGGIRKSFWLFLLLFSFVVMFCQLVRSPKSDQLKDVLEIGQRKSYPHKRNGNLPAFAGISAF